MTKYKYFAECENIADVKTIYIQLVKRYHPDRPENGDDEQEILKEVNNEYEKAFAEFKDVHRKADGTTYNRESAEVPEQFKDVLFALVRLDGIFIEIIGEWLWVTGATKQYKEYLNKELKMRWHSKKKAWYWYVGEYKKVTNGETTFEEIRAKYGSTVYNAEEKQQTRQIAGGF